MKRPKSIKSMNEVWSRLMKLAGDDEDSELQIAAAFNQMLDDLSDEDFFGTEGQNDPRGDNRTR